MRSIILYKDDAVIAMMAGKAYCSSNLPTGLVPNSNVACLLSLSIELLQKYEKDLEFRLFHTTFAINNR